MSASGLNRNNVRTIQNRTKNGVQLTKEKLLPMAGGRIWTGRQLKERGLVDELGTLTWRQLDQRADALGAGLQALPSGQPKVIGIMCRNHRGFVDALVAANRIGSDVLLLNTSFGDSRACGWLNSPRRST